MEGASTVAKLLGNGYLTTSDKINPCERDVHVGSLTYRLQPHMDRTLLTKSDQKDNDYALYIDVIKFQEVKDLCILSSAPIPP